jgi:hypothetical protein
LGQEESKSAGPHKLWGVIIVTLLSNRFVLLSSESVILSKSSAAAHHGKYTICEPAGAAAAMLAGQQCMQRQYTKQQVRHTALLL